MLKVTSIEHADEINGYAIDYSKFSEMGLPAGEVQPAIDDAKIKHIIKAHNNLNNWVANWRDSKQRKYCVWAWVVENAAKPAGLGLSSTNYGNWHTYTIVGARLHVGSAEAALYIGTDYINLFESAWLIIPEAT